MITSLIYGTERGEPAFLRKLKGQYGGLEEATKQEQSLERPKKRLIPENDADDAPTYVDISTHETLSKEAYDALQELGGMSSGGHKESTSTEAAPKDDGIATDLSSKLTVNQSSLTAVASIGSKVKKRMATVVRDSEEEGSEQPRSARNGAERARMKQRKKIKISFENEVEE